MAGSIGVLNVAVSGLLAANRALTTISHNISNVNTDGYSRQRVDILKRQHFNDAIPANLPAGTPVAHKTGSITKLHHDAAIVMAPRPFVLVVLTRGLEDIKQSAALMARIARVLYDDAQ